MNSHSIIAWLIIGALAGWLAGVLHIHVGSGWISSIITAAIGAALLIFVLRAVRRV